MLNFVLFLLVLMIVVSLITALVVEAIKKIVSEESIKLVAVARKLGMTK